MTADYGRTVMTVCAPRPPSTPQMRVNMLHVRASGGGAARAAIKAGGFDLARASVGRGRRGTTRIQSSRPCWTDRRTSNSTDKTMGPRATYAHILHTPRPRATYCTHRARRSAAALRRHQCARACSLLGRMSAMEYGRYCASILVRYACRVQARSWLIGEAVSSQLGAGLFQTTNGDSRDKNVACTALYH